jgi:hypothetical protein
MNKISVFIIILFLIVTSVAVLGYLQKRNTLPEPAGTEVRTETNQPSSGFPLTAEKASTPTPFPTIAQIPLTVTAPSSGSTVTTPIVTLKGKSSPKADVFINDKDTVADSQGNFSVTLTLEEGSNEIIISANNADGSYSEQVITVTYDPAQ